MIPNYVLRFKCKGRTPFVITCESPEELPELTRKYCVETGDCCAVECPADNKPAISVATRTSDGQFVMEVAFEEEEIERLKQKFKA